VCEIERKRMIVCVCLREGESVCEIERKRMIVCVCLREGESVCMRERVCVCVSCKIEKE